jgi:hypothetical protein
MKLVILYRPNSEHARRIEEFARDFSHAHGGYKLELISLDTREGAATATLYGIMQYPAILALQNDGSLIREWQGGELPLMRDLAYHIYA